MSVYLLYIHTFVRQPHARVIIGIITSLIYHTESWPRVQFINQIIDRLMLINLSFRPFLFLAYVLHLKVKLSRECKTNPTILALHLKEWESVGHLD